MSDGSSMIDRPLDEIIKDEKKKKQQKAKTGDKAKQKKPQQNQQNKSGGAKPAGGNDSKKNNNNKPKQGNNQQQQQKPQQKKHAGTGGHLAKVRAAAESKGPQQKQNKFKPAVEKGQRAKQNLDNLKITVDNKDKGASNGRDGIFKQHQHQPKQKPQQSQQDRVNTENLRISVAVPKSENERKDVKSQSKAQTKEKAKQKVVIEKQEKKAAQLHERRVVSASNGSDSSNKPKTLSERWSAPAVAAPASGSRVVYISHSK